MTFSRSVQVHEEVEDLAPERRRDSATEARTFLRP